MSYGRRQTAICVTQHTAYKSARFFVTEYVLLCFRQVSALETKGQGHGQVLYSIPTSICQKTYTKKLISEGTMMQMRLTNVRSKGWELCGRRRTKWLPEEFWVKRTKRNLHLINVKSNIKLTFLKQPTRYFKNKKSFPNTPM